MFDKIVKYATISAIVITFLLIVINPSTRDYICKLSEIHKLEKKIEKITAYNDTLQKRLLHLQTKPKEMEKEVKSNLGYIGEDEILYKFNDDENNNIKG